METLIEALLQTESHYGNLACGPNFVIDLRLVPTPANLKAVQSIAPIYKFVNEIYQEVPLDVSHSDAMISTLERDRTSKYWTAAACDRVITPAEFLHWLQECFLAEEFYEDDAYLAQLKTLTEFAGLVQPELFGKDTGLMVHTLTDTNNENTPYGVYVAIGSVRTLVVVTCWIL